MFGKIGMALTATIIILSTLTLSTSRSVAQQPATLGMSLAPLQSMEDRFPQSKALMRDSIAWAESLTPEQTQAIAAVIQRYEPELDALGKELADIVVGENAETNASVFLPLLLDGSGATIANQAANVTSAGPSDAQIAEDMATFKAAQQVTTQLEALQAQINQEVAALSSLSAEQRATFQELIAAVGAMQPAPEADPGATLQYNSTYCYYGFLYSYYAQAYAYYTYLYALYTYVYGYAYAYYAYIYSEPSYVYAYYAYAYVGAYCF